MDEINGESTLEKTEHSERARERTFKERERKRFKKIDRLTDREGRGEKKSYSFEMSTDDRLGLYVSCRRYRILKEVISSKT